MTLPRIPTALLVLATWSGVLGVVASLAVHALTFTGTVLSDAVFALHGGVFVTFVPVLLAVFGDLQAGGVDASDRRAMAAAMWRLVRSLPGPALVLVGAVFAYAMVNFIVGFAAIGTGGENAIRMFSGHWMAFYTVAAVFGWRLVRSRREAVTLAPGA